LALACTPAHAPIAPSASEPEVVWRYEVRAHPGELEVEARFTPAATGDLVVDEDATPFVRELRRGPGAVTYRFALREAATAIDDVETAIASGDVVVAPPSTWLLHPREPTPGRMRFHVASDSPLRFTAAMHPAADRAPDTFEADTADLADSSFAVFGGFHPAVVTAGAARVDVAVAPHALALSDADVTRWVKDAVDAIAGYYGRFPVARTLVIVQRAAHPGPTRGETLGSGGAGVLVRAGDGVTADKTRDDWVMTHELLHVTLPSLSRAHGWLSEGIPTYVEPLARARAGLIKPEKVWADLVDGLPQGLPQPGDEGLERTHTWGRTYWGGTLFCLLADVAIREKTGGARSFDDALRAVVATGADVETYWEIDRFLEVGDRATGTRVLHDLYRDLALAPGAVDLAALWAKLGVRRAGVDRTVTFDDSAPLAAVRKAIAAAGVSANDSIAR
jgi:hypothetical protein